MIEDSFTAESLSCNEYSSGLVSFFENPQDLYDRFHLKNQGNFIGIKAKTFDDQIDSIIDKFFEYKCFSSCQQQSF